MAQRKPITKRVQVSKLPANIQRDVLDVLGKGGEKKMLKVEVHRNFYNEYEVAYVHLLKDGKVSYKEYNRNEDREDFPLLLVALGISQVKK